MHASGPPLSETALREQLTQICHRLYQKGLIAAGDGNVSCRLGEDRVLVTPSGFHKGFIAPQELIVTDLQGRRKRGEYAPSSEFMMHALCYAERPDIGAVVHAHPPIAVALALAGESLSEPVLSESCLVLGPVLTAPYSTPTTAEVPQVLAPYVRQANAVVMHRHGALTLGRNLHEAWHRMETLEHSAKILHAARVLGPIIPIGEAQAAQLEQLARKLGIPRAPEPCTLGGPVVAEPAAANVAIRRDT